MPLAVATWSVRGGVLGPVVIVIVVTLVPLWSASWVVIVIPVWPPPNAPSIWISRHELVDARGRRRLIVDCGDEAAPDLVAGVGQSDRRVVHEVEVVLRLRAQELLEDLRRVAQVAQAAETAGQRTGAGLGRVTQVRRFLSSQPAVSPALRASR